jgi:hypothetical protein
LPLPDALFGTNVQAQLVLAVSLGALTAWCFYLFLRALSLGPIHAMPIAVLSFLFPWSDASRLWATASINNLAVCAYLIGSVVALRGLRAGGFRSVVLHGAAMILYLLSLVIYEVAACAIALSILLYRTRAPLQRATRRWFLDLLLVLTVLGLSAIYTSRVRFVASPTQRLHDIPDFAQQGLAILASSFLPSALDSRIAKAAMLVGITAVIAYALMQSRKAQRDELRDWLRVLGVAALGVVAAYVMFLGSSLYPSSQGLDTRLHLFAGLALSASCYAIVALAVNLLPFGSRQSLALIAAGGLVLAVGFGIRARDDIDRWDAAPVAQRNFIAALKRTVQRPPSNSTIFSFGYPGEISPGIPIFSHEWDLNGALRLSYNDPSLNGLPILRRDQINCEKHLVYASSVGRGHGAKYGKAIFVDVTTHHRLILRSQSECAAALRHFSPGPLVALDHELASAGTASTRWGAWNSR